MPQWKSCQAAKLGASGAEVAAERDGLASTSRIRLSEGSSAVDPCWSSGAVKITGAGIHQLV